MKKRMIAAKPFRYGTRMLQAGDVFEASPRDARLLGAVKRAREYVVRAVAEVPPPPKDLAISNLDALREKARSVGLKPHHRWSEETLAKKIAEASS